MDDSSYRKILIETRRTKSVTTARKSMLNLAKLRADKITTFGAKVVILSARICVIQKYTKFANFAWLYFPHFTTFRDQTLQFY